MKTLTIAIGDNERRCDVDASELQAWSRALLDDLLLEAAIAVGERDGAGTAPVAVDVTFSFSVDEHGAIVVAR